MNSPKPIFFTFESACPSVLSAEESRALETLLGVSVAQYRTIEQVWATCLRPDHFKKFQKNRSALGRPGDVHSETYELKRISDGAARHILICETLQEDASVQGMVADITEWVERANNATAAAAEATRQLASFGHDLRQPLQILTGYLDMFGDAPSGRASAITEYLGQRENSLKMCVRTVQKLDDLITGMLRTAPQANEISRSREELLQDEAVDLFELAKLVAEDNLRAAEAKGLKIRLLGRLAPTRGKRVAIERILRNLIENAVKYTTKGQIVIYARQRAGFSRVDVVDTGRGIAPGNLALIWEHNARADAPEAIQGYGIGLDTVKRLAVELGARVGGASRLGKGSRFWLELPSIPPSDLPADPTTSQEAARRGVLLLVEDSAPVGAMLRHILATLGWRVDVVTTAADAIQYASKHAPPDAVICDYFLGDGNGLEVISQIRRNYGKPLPGILVTSSGASDLRAEAAVLGVKVLQKPARREDLLRALPMSGQGARQGLIPLAMADKLLTHLGLLEAQTGIVGTYDVDLSSQEITFSPRLRELFRTHSIQAPSTVHEFYRLFMAPDLLELPQHFSPEAGPLPQIWSGKGRMRLNQEVFATSHTGVILPVEGRVNLRAYLRARAAPWLARDFDLDAAAVRAHRDTREALQRLIAIREAGDRSGAKEVALSPGANPGDEFAIDMLVRALLQSADIEAPLAEAQAVSLRTAVEAAIGLCYERAASMKIEIRSQLRHVSVWADRVTLIRSIQLLLLDAIGASARGSRVLVGIRLYRNEAAVQIFQQKNSGGPGPNALAALRAKGIGRVSLASNYGLYRSAIHIPLAQMPPQATQALPPSTPGVEVNQDLPKLRVLFADDEEDLVVIISRRLRKFFDVLEVADNWLGYLKSFPRDEPPPDILVVDYNLAPGVNGLDVVREARAIWGNVLPAICLTSMDEMSDPQAARQIAEMREHGIAVYRKPMDIRALVAAIQAAHDATYGALGV
jgi:signal transduction histidine kinase/DNA-binding response OmpR family regulator